MGCGGHYVGGVHKPWSMIRKVFDAISDSNLKWALIDVLYDQVITGGCSFNYVAGREEFKQEVKFHFPDACHGR